MYKLLNSKTVYAVCLVVALVSGWSYLSLKLKEEQSRVQRNDAAIYRSPPIDPYKAPTAETPNEDAEEKARASIKEQPRIEQRGYLVVLDIPEQFTSATEDLAQLYMFNQKHLKLRMIEPYVLGSRLKTVPPVSEDFESLPLISTFLNRSHMLNNLKRCFHSDHVDLHSFPDFLVNAARQFIVVRFITAKTATVKSSITDCNFNMKYTQHLLNFHLDKVKDIAISKYGEKYNFSGVHSLCVRAVPEEPISMREVAQFIRTWMTNTSGEYKKQFTPQFSVIVPEWRAVKNRISHHYYYDPSYTGSNMTGPCQLQTLPHTSYVTQAAKSMLQYLSLSQPFVAVHVRSERIAQQELEMHKAGFIDSCICNFSKILQVVMKEHNVSLSSVVFIHDGNQYGSDSMWESRRKASNTIVSEIEATGIKNVQYKPQTHSTNTTSTSVASALAQFVEKEFLVSADVLITLGYGGFQNSLITRFKSKNSGGSNWYKLCSDSPRNDHLPLTYL